MNIRIVLMIIAMMASAASALAQNVELKKGAVSVDKAHVLDYTYDMISLELHIYKLGTKDELIFIKLNTNGTSYDGDDYTQLYFSEYDVKVESKSMFFGIKGDAVFKKLVADGVVKADGSTDKSKLDTFFRKYDEKINNKD